ncbi:MAG TPA: hypothetical protein VN108_01915, partial [Marmoricola sp.]|nr:hypothetical protein [Marmoricola sp.]
MRPLIATLCNGANVSDGLLNLIGAGITGVEAPGLPLALNFTLVVQVDVSDDEHVDRSVDIEIVAPSGTVVARAAGSMTA